MQRRDWLSHLSLGCLSSFASVPAFATQPPSLWLASPYQGNETLTDYWVSENTMAFAATGMANNS